MADYGSVRHPMYSIGEGVFSEKEARIKAQGLDKKKKKKKKKPSPPPPRIKPMPVPVEDKILVPEKMPTPTTGDIVPNPQNIMDKIWGNKIQTKKKIRGL